MKDQDLLHVYACTEGPWLLVPTALVPRLEARTRHGRLAYVGAFASQRLSMEEHAQVMVQCDADSVSAIPARTALRLLAPVDAPWRRHVPRWLRPSRKAPRGERGVIDHTVASTLPGAGAMEIAAPAAAALP